MPLSEENRKGHKKKRGPCAKNFFGGPKGKKGPREEEGRRILPKWGKTIDRGEEG